MQRPGYVESKRPGKFQSSAFHDQNTVPFSSCLERRHLVAVVSVPLLIRHLSRFAQIKIQRALNGHWRHVSNYCVRILHLPLGGLEINGSLLKGAFRSICPNQTLLLPASVSNTACTMISSLGPEIYIINASCAETKKGFCPGWRPQLEIRLSKL